MKQYKVLQWAFSFLKKHNREEKVAEILLQHVTKQNPTTFFMNMQDQIDEKIADDFKRMIKEHATNGTPIQHMIGSAPFYGREFIVNENVLIPRFETEEVVHHAIEQVKKLHTNNLLKIVDLGTGSGVIAITMALELQQTEVYATDISKYALQVARKNATKHGAHIQFSRGDFLQPLIEKQINPDVVISNPPYIAMGERQFLADTVKNYDPALALFAENDGLAAYETIVQQIATLPPIANRLLIFEIGYAQGDAVKTIIKQTFTRSKIDILQDMNGKDRIISATLL